MFMSLRAGKVLLMINLLIMAVHVQISSPDCPENNELNAKIHFLPCSIKANGDAKVSKYFEPTVVKQESDVLASSFRGYPLMGKELILPEGYLGFIMYEANEKLNEETDRTVYLSKKFKKFNYWNYDKAPSVNDGIVKAMNWISLANAIHSPMET